MANVEHSTLTTTNLHENKGVSTATDNTVATAVTGATVWAKLTASNLTGTGNSFGAQLLHIQDSVGSGTQGQNLTTSIWNKHTLQTTPTNEIASASLVSSVISLPAGTYYAEIDGTWYNGNQFNVHSKLRLRDTTSSTTLLNSTPAYFVYSGSITASCNNPMTMKGRFTLAGTKNIELQQWVDSGSTTAGRASSSGEVEIYANVMIWKIA